MTPPDVRPLRYDPAIERPELGEAALALTLRRLFRDIQETTLGHYGHAMRGIHTKSHGLLEGELEVAEGLPPELAQGLFARPGRYPAVMRLSVNRGDVIDDDVSVPRGFAIKIIGVEGERLPGAEGHTTQDLVLVNQPAFTEPDLKVFVRNMTMVDLTTDTGLVWKKALGAALRPLVAALKALGLRAWTLTTIGGHPLSHPLGDTYYSQVPFRYGDHVAKLALAPATPALRALKDRPVDLWGRPNGLREELIRFFRDGGGVWELRVQLRTNPATMPIEDASVIWPERESPYRTVARLVVPPQPAWSEARARAVEDGLAFNPWNGLAAHQPLGAVNRARRDAYPEGAAFRARHNGCPIHEPRGPMRLPTAPAEVYGTSPGREGRRPGTPDAIPGVVGPPMRDVARALFAGAGMGLAVAAGRLVLNGNAREGAALDPLPAVAGGIGYALARSGGAPIREAAAFGIGFRAACGSAPPRGALGALAGLCLGALAGGAVHALAAEAHRPPRRASA
ncbi:catalase family protein [Salinarimonas soli]|uniref:catalase family protein n=1 Tax=Salinarimonas soli TaxID=1638099 RepID=UPI001F0ACC14|nr:catalase family protein [Salinarimonas soli]